MASISTQTATPKKFVLKQDASKLTDEELICEFKKRFIVPTFYTKDEIIEQVEEYGYIPDEDNVEKVIKNFNKCGQALDESLEDMIEDVFHREEEEDKNKDDYTEDVEEDPIQEATIDYSTYKEYFAEYYQEEKEHDDETFF